MKTTINFYMFRDAMENSSFSYKGLVALWEYFEQYEEETGEELELDPIAFRYEFSECEDIEDFNNIYGTSYNSYDEIEETLVIAIDDESFIIQDF